MSAATYDALQLALEAHVADERPDFPFLTDWTVVTASVEAESQQTSYNAWDSSSPSHTIAGLIDHRARMMDDLWRDS